MPTQTRRRRPYAQRVPIEVRRDQLLDAALQIVDRDGHGAVSIDAIAREAGVSRPVVYGAFDDLSALLAALLDRQQARALTALLDRLPDLGSARRLELTDDAGRSLHRMLCDDPPTWRIILSPPTDLPEVVRNRVDEDRARVRSVVEHWAPLGADAELFAYAVVAVLEQLGRLVLSDPQRFTPERLVAAARALLP